MKAKKKQPTYYLCQLQLFEIRTRQEDCRFCHHAYPHKHKKNCNGHCTQSNPYCELPDVKERLTQPIIDSKNNPNVKKDVRKAKKMKHRE